MILRFEFILHVPCRVKKAFLTTLCGRISIQRGIKVQIHKFLSFFIFSRKSKKYMFDAYALFFCFFSLCTCHYQLPRTLSVSFLTNTSNKPTSIALTSFSPSENKLTHYSLFSPHSKTNLNHHHEQRPLSNPQH